MNAIYRAEASDARLFADADAQYATMKETLTSTDFQDKTEAEVQRGLAEEQRELMRRLFQSHLTLRGQAEAQQTVVGADGVARTHQRPGKTRKLETVFGTVEAERTGHSGRGLSTLYPVDASLNLPETRDCRTKRPGFSSNALAGA